jgi:signal transduction histidine kinase
VLHDRLVLALIVAIIGLTVVAHGIIRRALAPIRSLHQGVSSLAAGELEVVVPRRSDDELGGLADAFNQMVGRVREMVRSRDRLLLDVSHELRSPLTRMRVALALWDEGEPRRRLERNVAEMEAMVTELLELERLRAGHGIEAGPHDLVEIVRDAVLAFSDRPHGVVLGESPASRRLEIDPARIRSVLNNLLENALRYALPDSGPVRVTVREEGQSVQVRVEDDGPGLPAEDLSRLFEPFFRVDRSRSRRTGGYGLGLSLCRRIMEAHRGTIEARNRPGRRGAELVLTFPG